VWAVVPAKGLGQAKSRLAPVLAAAERQRLMLRLLRGTMAALAGVPGLAGWFVVSRDVRILDLGRAAGGHPLREVEHRSTPRGSPSVSPSGDSAPWSPRDGALSTGERSDHLNAALRQARDAALARGATALLVVPGDLPLLDAGAVEALLARHHAGAREIVLAPAHDGRGTNALLLSPPAAVDLAFGGESAPRHVAAARAAGLRVVIHEAPEFALDLDTPADLDAVARLQGQWLGWDQADAAGPDRDGLAAAG
jgi:2-phospho-L-lactate guanylyltransferase